MLSYPPVFRGHVKEARITPAVSRGSLPFGAQFVSTLASSTSTPILSNIGKILASVVAIIRAPKILYPASRPVQNINQQLQQACKEICEPVVHYNLNPYETLEGERALILQGRNQEGKTTLLRTSLPWWRRVGPRAYEGLYLNGSEGKGVTCFGDWQTTQMYGVTQAAGSEIKRVLSQYTESQLLRRLSTVLWLLLGRLWRRPFGRKRPVVIVDQFEELLKQYPAEALDWANTLTNLHTRSALARVIFVVNSDAGAQTLLNLNQGPRFTKLILEPPSAEGANVDMEIFDKCGRNIGLYKLVLAEIDRGAIEKGKEETFIKKQVRRWEEDFHVPYPLKYDRSWSDLADEKSLPLMKQRLGQALEQVLLAQKGQDSQPMLTPEKVKKQIEIATRCWETLDKMQVLDAMEPQWAKRLEGAGAEPAVAESLAKHIRCLIGNPVPNEQGEGQGEPRSE